MFVVLSGRIAIGEAVAPTVGNRWWPSWKPGTSSGRCRLFDKALVGVGAGAWNVPQLVGVPFDVVRSELESRPELLWDVVELPRRPATRPPTTRSPTPCSSM